MNAPTTQPDRSRLPAHRGEAPSRAKKVSETLDKIDETYLAPFRTFERLPAVAYGAPVANGASTGSVLAVKGLTPGAVIRKGKFLSIILSGQRFVYMVTAQVTVPIGGLANLPIWPMLRRPTADGAVIELAEPKIEGFIEPGQDWSINSLKAVGMSFALKERE